MEKKRLDEKLHDFLSGSEPLDKIVSDINDPENKDFKDTLYQLDRLSRKSCQPDKARMWANIREVIVVKRRRLSVRHWAAIAAILIPAVIGGILFWYSGPVVSEKPVVASATEKKQVQLLLGGGRVVNVLEFERDSIVREEGAGIHVDSSCSIVYTPVGRAKAGLVFNTLRVPRSCEYRLVLADGTQVWLNSDSELRFPVDFVGNERRVFLKGEAYFQVARDADKPFRVEAGEMIVEALGTGFDVNAYRDGGNLTATLVEGRVRVSDKNTGKECVLIPGKQACIRDGLLETADVKVTDVIGWKEGRFVFNNMTLAEIAGQLERWYDIHIVFQDDQLRGYCFTGVMKRYNELTKILEFIEETTNVKFQVDGQEIVACRR